MEEKGTILIVDDSAGDRALFRTILARAGYKVFEVDQGSETLAKALEVRPHVIVLDVNLPDLSGLDVCRALRADPQAGGIPVLMLTVRHDDSDVLAGLQAGADDYVAKDSAPELVLARVRRLCSTADSSLWPCSTGSLLRWDACSRASSTRSAGRSRSSAAARNCSVLA